MPHFATARRVTALLLASLSLAWTMPAAAAGEGRIRLELNKLEQVEGACHS